MSVNLANIMRHSLLYSLWFRDPASLGISSQGSSGGRETLNPPSKHLKPKMNWIMEAMTKSPIIQIPIRSMIPVLWLSGNLESELKNRDLTISEIMLKPFWEKGCPFGWIMRTPWETSIYQMKQKKIETWINLSLLKKMNS